VAALLIPVFGLVRTAKPAGSDRDSVSVAWFCGADMALRG
jgi:hypothetical protein